MFVNGLIIACIFGVCPFIEAHVLQFIEVETFLILCASVFFVMALIYGSWMHHGQLRKDLVVLGENLYLIPVIALFVFLFHVVTQYLYLHTMHRVGRRQVSHVIATYPFVTLILAYLFWNERLSYTQFAGCLAIILGVTLVLV